MIYRDALTFLLKLECTTKATETKIKYWFYLKWNETLIKLTTFPGDSTISYQFKNYK
jgi:hypothetical protein